MPLTERPPTEFELLERRCRAVRVAITVSWPEEKLLERTVRARRSLFVKWLIATGRLNGPMSGSSSGSR